MSDAELVEWLRAAVSGALGVPPEDVDVDAELGSLGLDSIQAFTLTGDLAETLDRELSATLMWEHKNLRALARALCSQGR